MAGRRKLYDYCASHKIDHNRCGKWIIATDQSQLQQLEAIYTQAQLNGVSLQPGSRDHLRRKLPFIQALEGFWSAETGIIDSHGLMLALLGDLEDAGGQLALSSRVVSAESGEGNKHLLYVDGLAAITLEATEVVNAAGLGAPALAQRWQGLPDLARPQQWLARGVYFSYSGRHPFNTLIYPVPEPGGLGVHLTLDLAGQARFGPDVEWIQALDYNVNPERVKGFIDGIRRWWPWLDPARLQPAYAGIRPKLSGPGGGFDDFRIDGPEQHGVNGLVNLFGIESPGLTSCLAIAEQVRLVLDS